MPRNAIITEGFTSTSVSLVTAGWADLQEIAVTSAGTLLISGSALSQRILEDYIYQATGELLVSGIAQRELEFEMTPAGQILVSGIAARELNLSYGASGQIILNGSAATLVAGIFEAIYAGSGEIIFDGIAPTLQTSFYTNVPFGELVLSGLSNTLAEAFFVVTPDGEILLISGSALSQTRGLITQFVDFIEPEEVEELFNYATGLTDPQYQKEIRGGRKLAFEDIRVTASSFGSLKSIKGTPDFSKRRTTKENLASRNKVIGVPKFNPRKSNKDDFDGKQ